MTRFLLWLDRTIREIRAWSIPTVSHSWVLEQQRKEQRLGEDEKPWQWAER